MDYSNWKKEAHHSQPLFSIRTEFLIALFLVITTCAVYWQVGNHDFVAFDDDAYITKNPQVQAGLTSDSILWAFTAAHADNWHPLTWLSLMLDIELYGMNPGQMLMTNLFFHIANTLLLFLVLCLLTSAPLHSGFVAALFALHPLHVESVAWVSERKDVLSTFFWMLTMLSYIRYVEQPDIRRYLTMFLFFMLGLMSKPMLVTLPIVLLLLDYWPLNRWKEERGKRKVTAEKLPLFALAAASGIVTFIVQQSGGAVKSLEAYPFSVRIANATVSYISYIGKMIWPSDLAFFYPHPGMLPAWQIAGACLLLVLITLLAIRMMKPYPWLAVGWLWYVVTLLPVIGLVQVGLQSMADRYTYIPFIGIFIIIAWGVPELLAGWRYRKLFLTAVAAFIIPALMAVTYVQVQYWGSSILLFEHALDVTDDNYVAHHNLGLFLQGQGRTTEAIEHYTQALHIKPAFAKAHNNIGTALEEANRPDQALWHYSEALRINPSLAKTHNNMAVALEKQGRTDEAAKHYSSALGLKPDYFEPHINLGVILFQKGKVDEAIFHLQEALRIKPDSTEALNNLSIALFRKGKVDEAIFHLQEALRIKPDYADAYNNLKKILSVQQVSAFLP